MSRLQTVVPKHRKELRFLNFSAASPFSDPAGVPNSDRSRPKTILKDTALPYLDMVAIGLVVWSGRAVPSGHVLATFRAPDRPKTFPDASSCLSLLPLS